ncbi:hypothetical protein HYC85_021505 [Camellia sinensis]|uniref:Thioredoxin domain-containing protein n=1 Tax=Camellia sinensis TaxID=4442 RepID=A0A7J7GLU3_CAMSI|nr:hypothetical protein HYC85_021505 [Camellia sinensis]
MSCILMVALALFLLIFGAFPSSSRASIDSGSILSTVIDNNKKKKGDQPDFAVDLNATNFDAVLRDTPSTHAINQRFSLSLSLSQTYRSCSMSSILLLLALFLLIFEAFPSSSASIGSRSILRAVVTNNGDQPDFAVELNATNFDAVLKDTPATYAIVEFFANWCPACRNYKPHYEKVARLFNGPEAVHPGIILMTRVDCALKINNELCDKFSVGHYPMLLWAPPNKFVAGGWKPNQDKTHLAWLMLTVLMKDWSWKMVVRCHLGKLGYILLFHHHRLQLDLVQFSELSSLTTAINLTSPVELNATNFDAVLKDTPATYAIVEFFANWCPACRNYKPHYEKVARLFNGPEAVHPGIILMTRVDCALKIARAVYDVEEATSSAFDIILDHKMIKSETRASLIKFLQLLVAHHPSRRCRKGSAEFLVNFDELYPLDILSANKQESINVTGKGALENFQICGKEIFHRKCLVVFLN